MASTDSETQAGLRILNLSPEGKLMVAMLKDRLAAVDEKLRTASGEHLYRCQGRAQQLVELISEVEAAGQAPKRQDQSRRPVVWNQA